MSGFPWIVSFALQNPLSIAAVWRQLSHIDGSIIAPEQLTDLVRDSVDEIDREAYEARGKAVLKVCINGQEYYLRLYAKDRVKDGVRHLLAARLAAKANINSPRIIQVCSDGFDDISSVAILEEKITGTELGYREWSIGLASNLGLSLRGWHGIEVDDLGSLREMLIKHDRSDYEYGIRIEADQFVTLAQRDRELIGLATQFLKNKETDDEYRISHGDVQCHNLIINGDEVAWIDMDRLSLRPVWHDLALVGSELALDQGADIINAFESSYFGAEQIMLNRWYEIRQQWYVLVNVLMATKWLSREDDNPGSKFYPTLWARNKFAIAAAFASSPNSGDASTGEYIAGVYPAARVEMDDNLLSYARENGIDPKRL